jgi:predicted flap endonuclease-1-like 5' DNA nuclease
MDAMSPQLALYLAGAALAGAIIAWLVLRLAHRSKLENQADEWQGNVDNVIRIRDRLINEAEALRTTIENQQATVRQHEHAVASAQVELESAKERERQLNKDIFTLRAEREETKQKMHAFQEALLAVKQQAHEIQTEFLKSREFYKSELTKAFERRRAVEIKLDDARAEQDSFANLLRSSVTEKESVNKMLSAAKRRLENIDELEQKAIALEAENAQLKHDAAIAQQENDVLRRDVEELEELKVQNRELAQCVTSLEDSRKQYESDANRYKERAGQSEQKSETLRIKLDEVEKNFLDIEKQQRKALKDARKATVAGKGFKKSKTPTKRDDLQEIVGIGKVFEQALHELGIFTFRQIANFDISDIARVNAELKEFKGRMEQDDWVGQAKELHFKKYGS